MTLTERAKALADRCNDMEKRVEIAVAALEEINDPEAGRLWMRDKAKTALAAIRAIGKGGSDVE